MAVEGLSITVQMLPGAFPLFPPHGQASGQKDPQLVLYIFCYKTFNVNLQYNVNLYEKI